MTQYFNYVEKYKGSSCRQKTLTVTNIGMLSNIAIAVFHGIISFQKSSLFLNSSVIYYFILGCMKLNILKKYREIRNSVSLTDKKVKELTMYRYTSRFFLLLGLFLIAMLWFDRLLGKDQIYSAYSVYAIATYTFYKNGLAIVHLVRAKKEHSLLLTLIRRIGYADACVSLMNLQVVMLQTFSTTPNSLMRGANLITGTVTCIIIFVLGIQGIRSEKREDLIQSDKNNRGRR